MVKVMVFLAEHWETWLIFLLLFPSQTIYRTLHFLPTTTEKRDLFESHSWPREGFNFFRGRTLHLWQLQLSRVTTMVQFYTFGAYYQWRTQGRGPGSTFFGDPPPPPPPPPPLSQVPDRALVELQMDCQNLLHNSIQIFPNFFSTIRGIAGNYHSRFIG